ncbi:uroporphyrinogen-III C-methyltransferase [uncultured Draconibacterium sp.]|uniref:uroporphyrinogen-III C-methyltransferase n=1 Tax=uncultured Draconibacterium sp. TaxID=1573823 RepID=UPI0029C99422|nr:uroporphyrinogen-III C-methyltransferase [uncultured Draconibacterium sp.]
MSKNHLISIVGAGPGDPELLTVKAHKRLTEADVVLYDALHGKEMLKLAKNDAELIYVGKFQGDGQCQHERQDSIHRKMAELAARGKKVVRLKAGDPMVFGRGAEEIRFCKTHGLNYEVIPGITAGVAASGLMEVPITERHKSPMALFYTGHRTDNSLSNIESVIEVLKGNGTVTIYMGFKNIGLLIAKIMEAGIEPEMPVQIMSQVGQKEQSILSSTIECIVSDIHKKKPVSPAVLFIGRYATPITKEVNSDDTQLEVNSNAELVSI